MFVLNILFIHILRFPKFLHFLQIPGLLIFLCKKQCLAFHDVPDFLIQTTELLFLCCRHAFLLCRGIIMILPECNQSVRIGHINFGGFHPTVFFQPFRHESTGIIFQPAIHLSRCGIHVQLITVPGSRHLRFGHISAWPEKVSFSHHLQRIPGDHQRIE